MALTTKLPIEMVMNTVRIRVLSRVGNRVQNVELRRKEIREHFYQLGCGNWEELERVCRCKGDVKQPAECGKWEELERVCRCRGDVKQPAECGKWEELERVCRCRGDVKHTAECGKWEELGTVCRCKGDVKHTAEFSSNKTIWKGIYKQRVKEYK